MAGVTITQTCPSCGKPISATLGDHRVETCPHCHQSIHNDRSNPTGDETAVVRQRSFYGIGVGLVVSTVLHLILIATLSLIIIRPQVLSLSLVTSLLPGSDESGTDLLDMSGDLSDDGPAGSEDVPQNASEMLATGGPFSDTGVAGPAITQVNPGGPGGQEIGVSDKMAGFSQAAAGRLKKNTAAKRGEYEIALFWDGPTDLDLHVLYQSAAGKTREINFIYPGTPSAGFLDLDQNADDQPLKNDPIEHIRWNTKRMAVGTYQVGVHAYRLRPWRNVMPEEVSYTVEIKTPDGVKSYTGKVEQDDFDEIDTFTIGLDNELKQKQNVEALAAGLLFAAKTEIMDSMQSKAASTLKNIESKYPTTKAAREAREVLRQLSSNEQ